MRKWWWRISLLTGLVAVLSFCKSTDKKAAQDQPATPVETGTPSGAMEAEPARETDKASDEMLPTRYGNYPADSVRQEAPRHNAPDQEEIDSLKQIKTEGKRK